MLWSEAKGEGIALSRVGAERPTTAAGTAALRFGLSNERGWLAGAVLK
jgi:hypothetical protein